MLLTGKAAVYGVSGSLLFAGQVANQQDYIHRDETLSKPLSLQELTNAFNEPIGYAVTRKSFAITLDLIPVGGTSSYNTVAQAKAALDAIPSDLVTVTITGCPMTTLNTTFMYLGDASARLTSDNYAVLTMPLIAYSASVSSATTLTTKVSDSEVS